MASRQNPQIVNKKIERFLLVNLVLSLLFGLLTLPEESGSSNAALTGGKLFFTCSSRDIRKTAYKLCSLLHRKRSKRQALQPPTALTKDAIDYAVASNELYSPGFADELCSRDSLGCSQVLKQDLPSIVNRKRFSSVRNLSPTDFIVPYWRRHSDLLKENNPREIENYISTEWNQEDTQPAKIQEEIPFMSYEDFVQKLREREPMTTQELPDDIRHNTRGAMTKKGAGTVRDIRSYCCMHGCTDQHLIGLCVF